MKSLCEDTEQHMSHLSLKLVFGVVQESEFGSLHRKIGIFPPKNLTI